MSLAFRNEIDITVWLAGGVIADVAIQPRGRPPLMSCSRWLRSFR